MNAKEIIIEKLKKWIIETDVINYDESLNSLGWKNGFNFQDKKHEILRDGKTEKEVYVVSFRTKDYIEYNEKGKIIFLIEGMSCYAYFNAVTLDLMYIHKKAGYIELDGTY